MKSCRQSARFKKTVLCGLAAALGMLPGMASPAAEPPQPATWRVALAGFLRPANTFTQPIPGARETERAAACVTAEGALRFLNRAEFAALGVDWAAFSTQSAAAASAELASLQPEWVRDRNQVIECAILRAKRPLDNVTVAVLAPDFLQRFRPVFGSKMLVAVPDRGTVFLFPKLASRYQAYGERVLSVYQKSECPVSREVFELSATGLRAVGTYEGP
ncbi:MAG: hypothetical protein WCH57_01250 [Verrucomicrobiota bacterium]